MLREAVLKNRKSDRAGIGRLYSLLAVYTHNNTGGEVGVYGACTPDTSHWLSWRSLAWLRRPMAAVWLGAYAAVKPAWRLLAPETEAP